MVYVQDKTGKPLMPLKNGARAKWLLKSGRAHVISRMPFMIRLHYKVDEVHIDPLTLGIDVGTGMIGSAVFNENTGEILYTSKAAVRYDISRKMARRYKFRRSRRVRKLRYRNRGKNSEKNNKKEGRIPPTLKSKIDSHVKEINYVKSILPINKLIIEDGNFDTVRLKNPDISDRDTIGWLYQHGDTYGFENKKQYVLFRDGHKCQCCHGKSKEKTLEVHHIIFRSNGGSDRVDNLITVCSKCHKDIHDGKLFLKKKGVKKDDLMHATQMNLITNQLKKEFPEAVVTYGYITKVNRKALKLEKDHDIDACVIASEGRVFRIKEDCSFVKKSICKGYYKQTKGKGSSEKVETGKRGGFRLWDKVDYFGHECFIQSITKNGLVVLCDIYGNRLKFDDLPRGKKTPHLDKLNRISARKTVVVAKREVDR